MIFPFCNPKYLRNKALVTDITLQIRQNMKQLLQKYRGVV